MRLILRDIPVRGKPIVIDRVELNEPVVRVVVRDDGSLAGFTDFVHPSSGHKHADGGSTRPSDFLAIRKVTVRNGAFRWKTADDVVMEFDELEFDLSGRPDDEPGLLHPALMVGVLALGGLVLREGLRLRAGRMRGRSPDSRRHRRLGKLFVALVGVGFAVGLASMAWLRDRAVFESIHALLTLSALLGFLGAAALGLRLEVRPESRAREIHVALGAGGLLLALTAAVAGFAILP